VGADRLAARYATALEDLAHTRGRVVADSLELLGAFPVAGCGFGTYAAAYPLVRAPEVRLFYAHAHNDPLEFLVEGGLLGAGLMALAAVPLARLLRRALAGAKGALGVGIAAGVLVILVHGLVDFNFHIPANAVAASALAGALLGLPWKLRDSG
jgi:O-antigen ligase